MKPKIKARTTNLIAKLAGSPDYEAGIQPKEPIEFYLSDAIDGILAGRIGVTASGVVTATEQMTEEQAAESLSNLGGLDRAEVGGAIDTAMAPIVITMTPTVDPLGDGTWTCAKTWQQLLTAYSAGKPIQINVVGLSLVGGNSAVVSRVGNTFVAFMASDDDTETGNYYKGFYQLFDNGKYAWYNTKVEPETVVVTVDQNYQADYTPAEMKQLYDAGKTLVLHVYYDGAFYQLTQFSYAGDDDIASFTASTSIGQKSYVLAYIMPSGQLAGVEIGEYAFKCYEFHYTSDVEIVDVASSIINVQEGGVLFDTACFRFPPYAMVSIDFTSVDVSARKWSIIFQSGTTPTVVTGLSTIYGLENFTPAANTRYKIEVEDNYAIVHSWPITP